MSVYFATSGGLLKIGYSVNPFSRVGTITRLGTRPDRIPLDAPAELIGFIPGDVEVERGLHRRFAEQYVAGEWFDLDPAVAAEAIWADERGIDIQRMSMMAVLLMWRHPHLTRDEAASVLGTSVEAAPLDEALGWIHAALTTRAVA